jgi:two-component system, sensor histidine kinase
VCLISGDTEIDLKQQAVELGLVLLKKPVQPAKLRSLIRREMEIRR